MNFEDRVDALKSLVRDVPDFPKTGIVFKDITTLLKDSAGLRRTMDLLVVLCDDLAVDKVLAIESRGFIFGSVLADRLGAGFVPARKPGKLPAPTRKCNYALEYGSDSLEVHQDALGRGERVLIVDDVIATGGTAEAAGQLVREFEAEVAAWAFLVELTFLDGRKRLLGAEVRSLIRY